MKDRDENKNKKDPDVPPYIGSAALIGGAFIALILSEENQPISEIIGLTLTFALIWFFLFCASASIYQLASERGKDSGKVKLWTFLYTVIAICILAFIMNYFGCAPAII